MSTTAPVRWGVIATGRIAGRFAEDLRLLPDAELVAVGSRSQESADSFGRHHDVPHRHATYEALVSDDEVDVVYVATPHPGHHPAALAAIEAGKSVLVEKPFTMDAAQAQSLVNAAREHKVFLMEAMWTRFLPHVVRIRELLAAGALGELRFLIADHGQWFARDAEHRLFARSLGGGALLDLGIYPVSFASMVLGTPSAVIAASDPAFTGVDATTSIILRHESGAHASLITSLLAASSTSAVIVGTDARIEVHGRFYASTTFDLVARDGTVLEQRRERPEGNGLRYQAAEVARCLRAGALESPVIPPDETVTIMQTLDEIRRQIGLTYPASESRSPR